MGFKCGIVGLPNVGKSTLFNAITRASALAANYPFATVEPNVGRVPVRDPRVDAIAEFVKPKAIVPTYLDVVDIAGLVRGASRGEGLGNQFLANIREVDAILHVVRCFDGEVTHVEGRVDPAEDAMLIDLELTYADLETARSRLERAQKVAKSGKPEDKEKLVLWERTLAYLEAESQPVRFATDSAIRAFGLDQDLLSAKPVLFVANVSESDVADPAPASAQGLRDCDATRGAGIVYVSAQIESELAQLEDDERAVFLEELGLAESGLDRVVRAGYGLLGLYTFFTAGEQEVRAWTIEAGFTAPQAAGTIHTDFEKGFIRAETCAYEPFVEYRGWAGAREAGKVRLEGRDYVMQDGDVVYFRFNV